MGDVAEPYVEKAERELEHFLQTGEIPEVEGRKVARLMVEADGVMLSLQREKERKAEVKLGIAYDGWERMSKDRYRTVNKTAFAAVGGEQAPKRCQGQAFWPGMSLKLQSKYDLSGEEKPSLVEMVPDGLRRGLNMSMAGSNWTVIISTGN